MIAVRDTTQVSDVQRTVIEVSATAWSGFLAELKWNSGMRND